MSTPESKVVIEVAIAASPDKVWEALRDPIEIARWFGWDADSLADEIKYIFLDHAKEDGRRTLRFEGMPDRFELVEGGGGTLLRLVRDGAAGDDSDWDGPNEDMTEGWKAFMEQMRFALERHPGATRRTFRLSGDLERVGTLPRARLGWEALPAVGGAYAASIGPDAPSGQVWHRSRRQLAVTAEAYGDGLLLITDTCVNEERPHGGGSITVTTYGLDGAAFDAVHERWRVWWRENFPGAMKDELSARS